MKKKILITGGAGFIGSNLAEELVKRNYQVIILDNLKTGYQENLNELDVKFIKGDIKDRELVFDLVKDCFGVFHLAAMVSVKESVENPYECYLTNVIGSINLMDACSMYRAKFIFASSAAIYGLNNINPKTEDMRLEPYSPYGISKYDIEKLCRIYNQEKGLEYLCFRNFNVYGPKQDLNTNYGAVIPIFINRALNNQDLIIYGDGEQTRDFIYVKDVTNAYIKGLESDKKGVYNLGSNMIITINQLAKEILNIAKNNSSKIIYQKERIGDIKESMSNCDLVKKELNWKSNFLLEEGLKKTIDYFKQVK